MVKIKEENVKKDLFMPILIYIIKFPNFVAHFISLHFFLWTEYFKTLPFITEQAVIIKSFVCRVPLCSVLSKYDSGRKGLFNVAKLTLAEDIVREIGSLFRQRVFVFTALNESKILTTLLKPNTIKTKEILSNMKK